MSTEHRDLAAVVAVRRARRVGWWVHAWRSGGHRVAWTWWPTEPIARFVARWLGRLLGAPLEDGSA